MFQTVVDFLQDAGDRKVQHHTSKNQIFRALRAKNLVFRSVMLHFAIACILQKINDSLKHDS